MHTFIAIHKTRFIFTSIVILIITSILVLLYSPIVPTYLAAVEEGQWKSEVERIYAVRSAAMISGNTKPLADIFDTSQKYGQWGLEQEVRRVKYLKDWSQDREVKFTNIESYVRVKKVYKRASTIRLSIEESCRFDYIYPADPAPVTNSFGVGMRHTIDLIKKGGTWVVFNDWYTDCFTDATEEYSGSIDTVSEEDDGKEEAVNIEAAAKAPYYNRFKAIAYADKYCGLAWGSGNNYKYNSKYRNYSSLGGDCTNFASQVLNDREAGGIPMGGAWRYAFSKFGKSTASRAWVNADSFKDYLVYSGRGSIIKRGTYANLVKPTSNSPNGAAGRLKPGDLVAYEKKGNVDHFSIVTGMDAHGYPLVNSHTADRYHVPWDLGWGDNKVRFILIHVNG